MKRNRLKGALASIILCAVIAAACDIPAEYAVVPSEPNNAALISGLPRRDAQDFALINGQNTREPVADARYRIDGDNITLVDGVAHPTHTTAWIRFKELIPENYRRLFAYFDAWDDSSSSLGGFVYELAFTNAVNGEVRDTGHWAMALNISDLNTQEFDYLVLHEFGHVLTLSETQLPQAPPAGCPTFNDGLAEGCPLDISYFNNNYVGYWDAIYSDFQSMSQSQFFATHGDRFVSGYASTNPAEDIAETFATFVMCPDFTPGPGDPLFVHKVYEFYDYPEMTALRDSIRASASAGWVGC